MTNDARPLTGKVALVAGGTRGGGRGIAVELGVAGATVYVTGRSSSAGRSDLDRPETIEQTADADGTQPDWSAHWASALEAALGPLGDPL